MCFKSKLSCTFLLFLTGTLSWHCLCAEHSITRVSCSALGLHWWPMVHNRFHHTSYQSSSSSSSTKAPCQISTHQIHFQLHLISLVWVMVMMQEQRWWWHQQWGYRWQQYGGGSMGMEGVGTGVRCIKEGAVHGGQKQAFLHILVVSDRYIESALLMC